MKMSNELSVSDEELKAHFGSIKEMYKTQPQLSFSALIMGLFGVGKTRFILTGPGPWLVDSFDPKGTVVLELMYPELIKSGELIIRKFWNEDSKNPTEHERWEKIHEADISTGFLNYFGTYAVDSFTTWMDACVNRVSKLMNRGMNPGSSKKNQKLAIGDYNIVYDHAKDFIKKVSSFDCNFILTAHLQDYMDANDRRIVQIKAYSSLRTDIPILFTEKYVLETEEVAPPIGIKYNLYTRSAGAFRASTQLGASGKLSDIEVPDLKEIIRKTGFDYQDKKPLKEAFK